MSSLRRVPRAALTADFCVDVKDGVVTAEQLQLWQCAEGNPNQKWHTVFITNF